MTTTTERPTTDTGQRRTLAVFVMLMVLVGLNLRPALLLVLGCVATGLWLLLLGPVGWRWAGVGSACPS